MLRARVITTTLRNVTFATFPNDMTRAEEGTSLAIRIKASSSLRQANEREQPLAPISSSVALGPSKLPTAHRPAENEPATSLHTPRDPRKKRDDEPEQAPEQDQ